MVYEKEVQKIFSLGAKRYDLINRVISFRRDIYWRRIAVTRARIESNNKVLDLATGTGDIAIEVAKNTANNVKIIGVDFCNEMVNLAIKKTEMLKLQDRISFQKGKAENLPFLDNTFDRAIVAFGVRNFEDIYQGIQEIYRVLKDEGMIVILEFALPRKGITSQFTRFYIKYILPYLGEFISGGQGGCYYLTSSIAKFLKPEELRLMMVDIGFKSVAYETLTLGVVAIHVGLKTDGA